MMEKLLFVVHNVGAIIALPFVYLGVLAFHVKRYLEYR